MVLSKEKPQNSCCEHAGAHQNGNNLIKDLLPTVDFIHWDRTCEWLEIRCWEQVRLILFLIIHQREKDGEAEDELMSWRVEVDKL